MRSRSLSARLNGTADGITSKPAVADLPEYETVPGTARILKTSVATVWRRIADGTLKTVKIGGTRRVRLRESMSILAGD